MSLPVYYDSDLTGLTDSVREGGSKRNERGGGEEKLIQPNTLPPLCLSMEGFFLLPSLAETGG